MDRSRATRNREMIVCFRLLAEGRLSALSDFYDMVAKGLFGYIRTLVGSAEDAEDVLQEVFAKLAAHRKKLVRVENPHAYVFAMARNEAFHLLKEKSRVYPAEPAHLMFEEAVYPPADAPVLSAREAHAAMGMLPPLQREVVVLKIYEGFTFAQIGRLTGVSPNTAASRYRYALSKLASALKKYRER